MTPDSTIAIHRIFFCDDVSEGAFGKLNLSGYIPSNRIAINTSPYVFDSHIVIEGAIRKGFPKTNTTISVVLFDEQGIKTGDASLTLTIPECNEDEARLVLVAALRWNIAFGSLSVDVLINGQSLHSEAFKIIQGDAPNINVNGDVGSSALITTDTTFDLASILKSASRELILIDPYLTTASALQLLAVVPSAASVKVLAAPHYQQEYTRELQNIRNILPNFEVRFSGSFHDRFVIVNGTEYFHFGHSLKDLGASKLSRFQKMHKKDEAVDLLNRFNVDWAAAIVLA